MQDVIHLNDAWKSIGRLSVNFIRKWKTVIMGKVFICADTEFPRKGAVSNYIETFAKALKVNQKDVYVIAVSHKQEEYTRWTEYNQIVYTSIYYDVSNKRNTLCARMNIGKKMWNCIYQNGVSSEDTIICYTNNFFFMKSIYTNAEKRKIKVINCVCEWHIAQQFKYGYLDIFNFWYYCLGFYCGIGISGNVIAISRKLEEFFVKKGCKVLRFPPLIDFPQGNIELNKPCEKIKFIYSGSFKNKDSMQVMLKAFAALPHDMKRKVEFHITGYSWEKLYKMSIVPQEIWENVRELLVVHEWMEYNELIELYKQMHFLLIARETNRVTLSNFPSKVPEMMAWGIIPIMTQVGDLPNLYLEDGVDSILFSQCDVSECCQAITKAINLTPEKRRYMQDCARKKAEMAFDYAQWSEKIGKFIGA